MSMHFFSNVRGIYILNETKVLCVKEKTSSIAYIFIFYKWESMQLYSSKHNFSQTKDHRKHKVSKGTPSK